MDDALREKIRTVAEDNGIDPEMLEQAFTCGDMPDELRLVMENVLGDIGMFATALDKLDT